MAAAYADNRPEVPRSDGMTMKKKPSTFHPSLWGDFFLTYEPPTLPKKAQMQKRAGELREEVVKIIKGTNDLPQIVDLIITLQRLSLDYHYEDEINELLHIFYNSDYDSHDLYEVSCRFYLLRKSGYNVPSDVFLKFKDNEGNFIDADTRSILSLYNAAYLRTNEETLLDEAISFTRETLEDRLKLLESPLAEEVSFALDTPHFRKVRILDTMSYIPIYEKEAKRNNAVLEFAKVNFNLLQLLYCEELKEVTLWWKELTAKSNVSFVRDRIVEMHFWANAAMQEPQFSQSRIICSKMFAFITILDDFIDTYSTTEESMRLAEAIFSWDECAASLLPEHTREFYLYLLKTFRSFEDELGSEKSYRVFYLKDTIKQLVQAYIGELKWRDENYIPKTLSEHLELSRRSIGAVPIACAALIGMGKIVTMDTLEWFLSYPELLRYYDTFVRLSDDNGSHEREQTGGDHSASTIQCFMKEHGTTLDEARQKIKELIEDQWKAMLRYHLAVGRTEPIMIVSWTLINFARTGNFMYHDDIDKFTTSHIIQGTIKSLYLEPISI